MFESRDEKAREGLPRIITIRQIHCLNSCSLSRVILRIYVGVCVEQKRENKKISEIKLRWLFGARRTTTLWQMDRQWIRLKSLIIFRRATLSRDCSTIATNILRLNLQARLSAHVARCGGERACNAPLVVHNTSVYDFSVIHSLQSVPSPER